MSMQNCTVFTTALCNLDCKYCYICKDKNGGLADIDKDIEEMLSSGKCLENILAYGDNIENTLENICLWGGEPVLYLERFTTQIEDWFKAFPNLKSFMISTNFTTPDAVEKIDDLFKAIEKYGPQKTYKFDLQISIDGYLEMNDANRGEGTTQKILNNFKKFLTLPYNKDKIKLFVLTKPTVAKSSFQYLDSLEKCKKWVEFFNNEMFLPYKEANRPFEFQISQFNFAQPTEWTKEDGIELAKIMGYFAELNPADYEGLNFYCSLAPIAEPIIEYHLSGQDLSQPRCGGVCGSFTGEIAPIPHNKYTACHRGLFDEYVAYCNTTNSKDYMNGLSKAFFAPEDRSKWILTLDQLKHMHNTMSKVNTCPSQFIFTDFIVFIREYARQGIIDKKYLDPKEIIPTLPYFMHNSYCMQDGYIQTGSWTTMPTYEVPLLYNGAMDVAMEALKKYMEGLAVV